MARKPHDDMSQSERPATVGPREHDEQETAAKAMSPTRRQFVVGMSGALVGAAACGGPNEDGELGGPSASSGGASPTASGGASTTSGGTSISGGSPTASGGTAPSGGASTTSSGGTATASGGTATASGGAVTSGGGSGGAVPGAHKTASDRVLLGSTGIEVSRLAMGSGTFGSGKGSDQTRLGVAEFSSLLVYGYEQGLNFYETADAYGAHPHVAEAIRQVGRQNVVILTKTTSETAAGVEADLARFRSELGIDMIDIVLLHLKTSRNWTTQCEGGMEALAKAKQSGAIRAHGVSCHSIDALRLAAETSWVDVDLARVNPAGVVMDAEPATVINVLRDMRTTARGAKGVIGMKILGEGKLANQLDMAIKHAVDLDAIDAFTIGFTSRAQLDEVIQKIATV